MEKYVSGKEGGLTIIIQEDLGQWFHEGVVLKGEAKKGGDGCGWPGRNRFYSLSETWVILRSNSVCRGFAGGQFMRITLKS